MVYIKEKIKYYTIDECSEILDQRIKIRAKKISKQIVEKINSNKKEVYV